MTHWTARDGDGPRSSDDERRLRPDGGRDAADDGGRDAADDDEDAAEADDEDAGDTAGVESSNVEVTEPGAAEPVDPKWEEPDIEDIPEVDGPKTRPAESSGTDDAAEGGSVGGQHASHGERGAQSDDPAHAGSAGDQEDPTAGMPNTARSPGQSRLKEGGADGYVVALELCARLPDEVRLPEEAADLVPVALEAELEQDVQAFAADEFDNPAPHVDRLDFVEADGEVWLRLRLGVDPEAFADLDPEAIRDHALQQIDGLL